jgi:hypothetical protein
MTEHRVVADVDGQLVCACGERFALVWDFGGHLKVVEEALPCPVCDSEDQIRDLQEIADADGRPIEVILEWVKSGHHARQCSRCGTTWSLTPTSPTRTATPPDRPR